MRKVKCLNQGVCSGRLTWGQRETDISKHQQLYHVFTNSNYRCNVNKVLLTALFRPVSARRTYSTLIGQLPYDEKAGLSRAHRWRAMRMLFECSTFFIVFRKKLK